MDTVGQNGARLPAAPQGLTAKTGRHLPSHPAEMPPSPLLDKVGGGSQMLLEPVPQDPVVPLPIRSSSWEGIQACRAGLRSQDSLVLFLALPLTPSNIWSKILLSREANLASGEQLVWRLN